MEKQACTELARELKGFTELNIALWSSVLSGRCEFPPLHSVQSSMAQEHSLFCETPPSLGLLLGIGAVGRAPKCTRRGQTLLVLSPFRTALWGGSPAMPSCFKCSLGTPCLWAVPVALMNNKRRKHSACQLFTSPSHSTKLPETCLCYARRAASLPSPIAEWKGRLRRWPLTLT